jgi:phage repressor protein C with HTH and peptisase S24 domain
MNQQIIEHMPNKSTSPALPPGWRDPSDTSNNFMMSIVSSDSMEPTLSHGNQLLIDTSVMSVKREGIYALKIGNSLCIRRIDIGLDGRLFIKCDNPHYAGVEILNLEQADMLNIVGRVVWCARRLN